MKIINIITATILTSEVVHAKNVLGVENLTFEITYGDNITSSHKLNRPRLVKRDTPDGTVETTLLHEKTFFSVQIGIGDHADNVTVLVDTGSSDLWVPSSSNLFCSRGTSGSGSRRVRDIQEKDSTSSPNDDLEFDEQQKAQLSTRTSIPAARATIDCEEYGTFDEKKSSTFKSNNTEFYISYADDTFAYGVWGHDDITVGGTTVRSLSIAVASQANSSMGVLGIGLEELETTYSGQLVDENPYTYSNFPTKLVEDGLINRRVYSLFLDSAESLTGQILFGGVDHSKYSGDLVTFPLINTYESRGFKTPPTLQITLSGLGIQNKNNRTTLSTTAYPALLDSGTTLTYMPYSLTQKIAKALGGEYYTSGYYRVRCFDESDGYIVFNFQGKLIHAPLSNFVLKTSYSNQCYLGIIGTSSSYMTLGMSFLRATYAVYDLDRYQISLAQASYDDDDSNIEVVSDSVPSASSAKDYSATYTGYNYLTVDGDIFTISDDFSASYPSAKSTNTDSYSYFSYSDDLFSTNDDYTYSDYDTSYSQYSFDTESYYSAFSRSYYGTGTTRTTSSVRATGTSTGTNTGTSTSAGGGVSFGAGSSLNVPFFAILSLIFTISSTVALFL